ncbi:hypothetical protein WJX73_008289 [Symbiochloris irregularis]|uniref:Uncharacterized protein n=1 Tax=Symbiochloris irregularis TaxID=706552 RepID=A0AAW1P366_9CHLO
MPTAFKRLSFGEWLSLQSSPSLDSELGSVSGDSGARGATAGGSLRLVSLLSDCRAERHNIVSSKGRQDIQLTLVPPRGASVAPLSISLEQADAVLQHVTEPLCTVQVGELSRTLFPNVKQLSPNSESGCLQLWMTASSALSLVFIHRRQKVSVTQILANVPCGVGKHQTASLSAWQLPEDPTGQSFCIQLQSIDSLQDESSHDSSSGSSGTRERQKWFFWARTQADKLQFARLVALLRSPPTLTSLSGVPQAKLDEAADWANKAYSAIASRNARVQMSVVRGATASASLSEPAWGVTSSLSLQIAAHVRISVPSTLSSPDFRGVLERVAAMAKQQAEASAQMEGYRLAAGRPAAAFFPARMTRWIYTPTNI